MSTNDSHLTNTWPPTFTGAAFKSSKTDAKKAKNKQRASRRRDEDRYKDVVRARDLKRCRFPLCGCKRLGLALHVSHQTQHKGMGGDPSGARSDPKHLMLQCVHRHQTGIFSRHAGNLRTVPLTEDGHNGAVAFEAKTADLFKYGFLSLAREEEWIELARENGVHSLEPRSVWQATALRILARMDL